MEKIIKNLPNQFVKGIEAVKNIGPEEKYRYIVFCGMGGSIIPAKILLLQFSDNPHLFIQKNYGIPEWASKEDLVLCISWSGNTQETISSYNAARQKNIQTISITSGGELDKSAQKNNTPLVLLPKEEIPPRLAIGFMYGALSATLAKLGIIEDQANELTEFQKKIDALESSERAKELAIKIGDKTPLIYASQTWERLASFWKIFFNENSKIHSFWNAFPGMAHNEIEGFNNKDSNKFFTIFINDKDDDINFKKSIEKMNLVLEETGYAHETLNLAGNSKLEKIFQNYLMAAFTSFYLAEKRGINPTYTGAIEKFKKL